MEWYTDLSKQFMERGYLNPGQTVEDRISIIAARAEHLLGVGMEGYAEKFKSYMAKGWYSLSTPIWTNFGTQRALPISCFGSVVPDSVEGILRTHAETGQMTKMGGGTSSYFGKVRERGAEIRDNGKSSGSVHFMQLFDQLVNVISQGQVRRGSFAAYQHIDHPDIMEFLGIRSEGHPIQNISFGVCVSDDFMNRMKAGGALERKVWAKVLETRAHFGFPYIVFVDNANRNKPQVYVDRGMDILASNLCSEIMLPSTEEESFVCDLSSMNILHFDEWKDTDAVEVLTYLLDAVMTEFITKAKEIAFMERTVRFAERHRALGIGWVGYHSYLQSKNVAFESTEAKFYNSMISRVIRNHAVDASEKLAALYGEPEYLEEYKQRNATLTAIAPTKSSAFILGQISEGVEPIRTNYDIRDLAKGKFTILNPYLRARLGDLKQDTPQTWDSILKHGGSVQHLDWLSDEDKGVYRTMSEISPKELVIQASTRQKYIDQSQSLNLLIHPDIPTKDVNSLMMFAWEMGVKSLYYQHSVNAAQAFSRDILNCVSCE